ncbi:MAG: hypothetical protein HOO00_06450 [Rhodospirillaceae bacterium]|jgi:hypothetical protein|nr:hypothetical protein [Rhodospirillaceae bacterium]MBT5373889.1 hypothetical protein [Rhodospirillaceae bacterium]MBT5752505.1 hypothetical protein [Rhodospirillaceae bacterium]
MAIMAEISPGELIDKITILAIKLERIEAEEKLKNVRIEHQILSTARDAEIPASDEITSLSVELKAINEELWDIEDRIRDCERDKDFGPAFIDLARAVYKTNDRRSEVKRKINDFLGSNLVEEKSYAPYE